MSNLKRVGFAVTNNWICEQRGHKMVSWLISSGFQLDIWAKYYPGSTPEYGYSIRRIKPRFEKGVLFYLDFNLQLFLKLLRSDYTFYVANDLDTLPAVFFASKIKKVKFVFDAHEWFIEVPELSGRVLKKKIWQWVENLMIPSCYKIITVCQPIADYYQSKFGLDVQVVRNFPTMKSPLLLDAVEWVERLKRTNKIVIYQGAVNVGRGLENLIEAFSDLEGIVLIIIGEGDEYQKLVQKTIRLNLTQKVYFGGRIDFRKLASYTQYADLGVSIEEDRGLNYRIALPNKMFDYIQAGVPVLVSALPEMRKIVDQYKVGYILNERAPKQMAEMIRGIFADEAEWAEKMKNARKAAQILNWENECSKLKKVYN